MKPKIAALISKYADQSGELISTIEGLTDSQLDKSLERGKWSIRRQVNHLADSEINMVVRMKRVISEDLPLLPAYDQDKWADRLFYDGSSVDDSVAVFFTLRISMARVLRELKDKDFERFGIHTNNGKMSLLDLLEDTVEHFANHTKTIEKIKRKFNIK